MDVTAIAWDEEERLRGYDVHMNRDFDAGDFTPWAPEEWRDWHQRRRHEQEMMASTPRWLEAMADGAPPMAWASDYQDFAEFLGFTIRATSHRAPAAISDSISFDFANAYDRVPPPLIRAIAAGELEYANMEVDQEYQAYNLHIIWPAPNRDWNA
jgi:hypothetical protein